MKTSLIEYEGEEVRIVCNNGHVYNGYVSDYVYPEDNEDGIESIIVNSKEKNNPVELKQTEIKSIIIK